MNQVKCTVVMLPTEKAQKGGLMQPYEQNKLFIIATETAANNHNNGVVDIKPKHLYILSDEEIKEGDWKYNEKLNFITQHQREGKGLGSELLKAASWCKKIIATTDQSLTYFMKPCMLAPHGADMELPRPSNSFVKKYCELGGIDEVMVEYTSIEIESGEIGHCDAEIDLYLKVAPDNTITIHPLVEKIYYTKAEVLELVKASWKGGYEFAEDNINHKVNSSSSSLKDFILKNDLL